MLFLFAGSLRKFLQYPRQEQAELRSQELCVGLPSGQQGPKVLDYHLWPLGLNIGRKLDWKSGAGTPAMLSGRGCVCLERWLNHLIWCRPFIWFFLCEKFVYRRLFCTIHLNRTASLILSWRISTFSGLEVIFFLKLFCRSNECNTLLFNFEDFILCAGV